MILIALLVINRNFKNNRSELKCGGRFLAVSDKYLAKAIKGSGKDGK